MRPENVNLPNPAPYMYIPLLDDAFDDVEEMSMPSELPNAPSLTHGTMAEWFE
jgi:hypothetical protein